MAEFLKGNHLNSKLDEILEGAKEKLYLISPFIKFHSRVKEILDIKKTNHSLQIVVVFGKNERNKERSLSKHDFDYLTAFPNVIIKYEPRLHAKYYASENATLLSSMNLYEYSQNNNIEFGIYSKANGVLDNIIGTKSIDSDAWEYFRGVVENAEIIYKKVPKTDNGILGFAKKYTGSEVEIDRSNEAFGGEKHDVKSKVNKSPSGKLVSATALGKPVGKTYKDVVASMKTKGFVDNEVITTTGKKQGLEYQSNAKGDKWIVYPESLKDIL